MFDRLIESDTTDFKPRRRYFLVSSVVVGLLFVSAVIFSIYASEIGLGNDAFDVAQILAPTDLAQAEPDIIKPQHQKTTTENSDIPTRVVRQQPIDVTPVNQPPISVSPNKYLSLPQGLSKIGPADTNPPSSGVGNEKQGSGSDDLQRRSNDITINDPEVSKKSEPPPRIEKPSSKYIGVANGYATYLPKPTYPPPALSMGIEGKVDVQITINENGDVISAKAASGNMLLRQTAESAARRAKFKPTKLNDVPVKVTGVIVYNFTRN